MDVTLGWIDTGDALKYYVVVDSSSAYTFSFNLNWIKFGYEGVVLSVPSSQEDQIWIYPNPSSREVHIRLPENSERKLSKAEICSTDGKVIFSSSNVELINVNASRLPRVDFTW